MQIISPQTSDIPVALPLRTQIREYEIQELVGSGGFGFVYRAKDHTLQRSVALKEYFPASIATRGADGLVQSRLAAQNGIYKRGLDSFLTEARVLAQFDDPAVVKVHFFWEQDGTAYMVMPFYDGITLRGLVRHHQSLITPAWLNAFILRITDVLGRLHDAGTYHRDLSPENILILASGGLVLLDFGSSRQTIAGLTDGNEVVLKPGYAPIEQYLADDALKQGPWTDLYGLGAVLHFLLEGKAPPPSISRLQQDAYEPMLGKSDRFAAVPANILAGIDHCLAVQPEHRPPSVEKLRALFAIQAERASEDFSLYQGVAQSSEFAATNTLIGAYENDLTIPLDPIEVLPAEVNAGFLIVERPVDAVKEEKNAAAASLGQPEKRSDRGPVPVWLGLAAFILLSSVGLWLYLSISPPWKRPPQVAPTRNVGLKPSTALKGQASVPPPGNVTVTDTGTSSLMPPADRPEPQPLPPPAGPVQAPPKVAADGAPANGIVRLNIKPWGKLAVNGQSRGASPPLNQLKLAPGKYQIEISNPGFQSYSQEVEVLPGATTVIKHHFE